MANLSFWKGVFTDVDGSFSFKRVQTAAITFVFLVIVIAGLWKVSVPDNVLDLVASLMAYGYTGITIEKFTKRGISKPDAVDIAEAAK